MVSQCNTTVTFSFTTPPKIQNHVVTHIQCTEVQISFFIKPHKSTMHNDNYILSYCNMILLRVYLQCFVANVGLPIELFKNTQDTPHHDKFWMGVMHVKGDFAHKKLTPNNNIRV